MTGTPIIGVVPSSDAATITPEAVKYDGSHFLDLSRSDTALEGESN